MEVKHELLTFWIDKLDGYFLYQDNAISTCKNNTCAKHNYESNSKMVGFSFTMMDFVSSYRTGDESCVTITSVNNVHALLTSHAAKSR